MGTKFNKSKQSRHHLPNFKMAKISTECRTQIGQLQFPECFSTTSQKPGQITPFAMLPLICEVDGVCQKAIQSKISQLTACDPLPPMFQMMISSPNLPQCTIKSDNGELAIKSLEASILAAGALCPQDKECSDEKKKTINESICKNQGIKELVQKAELASFDLITSIIVIKECGKEFVSEKLAKDVEDAKIAIAKENAASPNSPGVILPETSATDPAYASNPPKSAGSTLFISTSYLLLLTLLTSYVSAFM